MASRFLHENGILKWLQDDFPEALTSSEGQRVLEKRADEIILTLDGYFTPSYMQVSENAKYLKGDLEQIRKAYEQKNYREMGKALEEFKLAVEWM